MLGAEDLVPLIVYVVIRSRMATLPAELCYVAEFLPPPLLHGKEGYALTTLQSATHVAIELSDARLGVAVDERGVPRGVRPTDDDAREGEAGYR